MVFFMGSTFLSFCKMLFHAFIMAAPITAQSKKVRSRSHAPKNAQPRLLLHKFQHSPKRGCQNRACVFTKAKTQPLNLGIEMFTCVATLFYQLCRDYATPQGKIFSLFSLSTPEGDFFILLQKRHESKRLFPHLAINIVDNMFIQWRNATKNSFGGKK